jgi:hypothetical protein
MSLQFGTGELSARLRRFLNLRGRIDLGLDESVVPIAVVTNLDQPPFRSDGYLAHRFAIANGSAGQFAQAWIDNRQGAGPVVCQVFNARALVAAMDIQWGMTSTPPPAGGAVFLTGERGAKASDFILGTGVGSGCVLATSVTAGGAAQISQVIGAAQLSLAGNTNPEQFREITIPKGAWLLIEGRSVLNGFEIAVSIKVFETDPPGR